MPALEFTPDFIGEEQSKQIASRQILPFLGLGTRKEELRGGQPSRLAPSKRLFTPLSLIEASFRKERPLLNWRTRPIYDIHGLLLFYDHTLPLAGGNELQVRTAASELLRTPVWSVRAGEAINFDGLISKALWFIKTTPNLVPVIVDQEVNVRLICYSYPKLGILCSSRAEPKTRFIVDLWDLLVIPFMESAELSNAAPESARAMWSPYDFVTSATINRFRKLFQLSVAPISKLPDFPERVEDLLAAIAAAGGSIQESCTTRPELMLVGQQTSFFCAAATAKMILEHYSISKTQDEIAVAMGMVFSVGARPEDQAAAIFTLTEARFNGELDITAEFDEAKTEIYQNRPLRTGDVGHARACGGFLIEGGGKEWLYIYDPYPPFRGQIYYEAWEAGFHSNYIYVRPMLYS